MLEPRRSVLVTGAAGRIASSFCRWAAPRYDLYLVDREELTDEGTAQLVEPDHVGRFDLSDRAALRAWAERVDTIVHLAADPRPDATWDELLEPNIVGTHNVFEAALAAGCRRVVFASSVHAVVGHAAGRQVRTDDPVHPTNLYGVSKCFGEALARWAAGQPGMSAVVVRIGAYEPVGDGLPDWLRDIYLAAEDLNELLALAIDDDELEFAIVHATSDNGVRRLDLTDTAARLGYAPRHGPR